MQVFRSGEITIDRRMMAQISHFVTHHGFCQRIAAPANFAGFERCQPNQQAQQTGFAAAVVTLDVQTSARREGKTDIGEQPAFASGAGKIGDS